MNSVMINCMISSPSCEPHMAESWSGRNFAVQPCRATSQQQRGMEARAGRSARLRPGAGPRRSGSRPADRTAGHGGWYVRLTTGWATNAMRQMACRVQHQKPAVRWLRRRFAAVAASATNSWPR